MSDQRPPEVRPLVEHLFRRESGRLTASLTRFFGSKHLDLAEDVVQDTLMKAMHEWPFKGIPDDPTAWLHRVAKNGAIDKLRRDARCLELLKENAPLLRSEWSLAVTVSEELREESIADDQLRMFFACCHPSLPTEQQVALVLKTLCGFSVPEIARAFVTNEETINKRLYRAREAFRSLGRLEIPHNEALNTRMEPVLASIYLLFNEGYHSTSHEDLIREDLIEEALRLCDLLTQNTATDRPEVHALLALMLFHAARSEARTGADGGMVLLADQDRSKWDRALIGLANQHLDSATVGTAITTFHLEAAIAGVHANAPSIAATNWGNLVALYDQLLILKPTNIVRMNRAIAIGRQAGPAQGLKELQLITGLANNQIYHAAMGDMLLAQGQDDLAREAYGRALVLATSPSERVLLSGKLKVTAD
jgi:RNA polymerase sigma factor (sigma-70 family)